MDATSDRHIPIVIAGSGFGGLAMAIRLRQSGIEDFAIFERAHDLGGVWRDNSYPGCACDVQSHLYSFSFAPNPDWTRNYSPQAEIWQYLRDCADRFGVRPHLRFGHAIHSAAWDDAAQRWRLETSRGTFTTDVFVAAVGALSEPSLPALPGLDRFGGAYFHSARWNHDFPLDGSRVAVIGTGASAIQFVPHIQPRVGQLHLFQRTPPWILPRLDFPIGARTQSLLRRSKVAQRLLRASLYVRRELLAIAFLHPERLAPYAEKQARKHLAAQVADPLLRTRLTPNYRIGCKRVLISDDYYPALTKPNVELVTDGIAEITQSGIVTRDGRRRDVDAIILGTGFHVTDVPFARMVRGRDGRTLDALWNGSPRAHLGLTVPGYPNFFFLLGPNTGLGHSSVILMIESQVEHVLAAVRHLRQQKMATIEARPEAEAAFIDDVDERMRSTVWSTGGCKSWYIDRNGRNSALWPSYTFSFRRRLRFDAREYAFAPRLRAGRAEAA